jgi:hypothetical protein
MKKFILPLLLMVVSFSLTAQNETEHGHSDRCGHSLLKKSMEAQYPGYNHAVESTFRRIKNQTENASYSRTDDVYTIPVVVHVVWKESEENISDERIEDQIAVLNEDYRGTNPDFANLRPEFADIAADTKIEFDLVQIIRVETTDTYGLDFITGGLEDNKLKDSANGGSSAADPSTHLNIWVCNIQPLAIGPIVLGQILGYAYPPIDIADFPDLDNWPAEGLNTTPGYDGVVIHYPAFGGRDRTIDDPNLGGEVTMQGRTTVHEVGHYLALRHIWGDPAQNPITGEGEDGCTVDDGIDDTPNASNNSQATGCDDTKNTCTGDVDDLMDMWENYMDYSVEACQVTFTQGQADIMRGVLEGPRVDLPQINTSNTEVDQLLENVTVSPNPTSGMVSLALSSSSNEDYQITVRDILGKQVQQSINNNGKQRIEMNLSSLANGVYFIEIQQGNVRAAKKVVLAK